MKSDNPDKTIRSKGMQNIKDMHKAFIGKEINISIRGGTKLKGRLESID